MSDLALVWDGYNCDLALSNADLLLDDGLQSAIYISLFSDGRAHSDDALPDGTSDRRGWWADAWPQIEGDQIGSRLWLLDREKELPETLRRAKEYAKQALTWLVDDGIAVRVDVAVSVPRRGVLAWLITLYRAEGGNENFKFDVLWSAI